MYSVVGHSMQPCHVGKMDGNDDALPRWASLTPLPADVANSNQPVSATAIREISSSHRRDDCHQQRGPATCHCGNSASETD
jgi:hypothetical protein